ncbi:MAG: LacI family DNA-binding transcriptional regulator [Terrimicrobiaceae bacterium]|nr:LacI family DNA-binding transcriptional regulator [Terrimicrobiaceae bacterium]
MTTRRRTNLRQIAQKLGISASTVSRALRELPGIHPETRRQVFEAAQEMGYRSGEFLAPKRPINILTVSQGISYQSDHEYLAGMSSAAVTLNMSLISHHYRPEECRNLLRPEFQPRALTSGQIDGIVLIHRWPDEVAAALRKSLPVVSIVHEYPGTDVDVISLDDRSGMDELVGHLSGAGYRRIGFFGYCPEMTWARTRLAGFVAALFRRRLEFRAKDIVEVSLEEALSEMEFTGGSALSRVTELTRNGVDAWIAASHMTAVSLHHHLLSEGFKVPRDVGMASFHSPRPSPASAAPLFTTTEAPSAELGVAALRRLVHRIEGSDTSRRIILLPCTVHAGPTTRKVAAKH